jgi:hypothetical protein
MQSTQTLPGHYQKIGTLDISKDKRLMLLFNFVGIIGLVISGWLFLQILFWLRPGDVKQVFSVESSSITQVVLFLGVLLGLVVFNTILHEAIHGFFFWLFTRSRPRFAFHWTYAYAAAPDWYLPKKQYLVIALSPLVLISLIGILLFLFVPAGWLPSVWFVLVVNAAGAVGDLAVAVWLLRRPSTCMAQDTGSAVTLFVPEQQ